MQGGKQKHRVPFQYQSVPPEGESSSPGMVALLCQKPQSGLKLDLASHLVLQWGEARAQLWIVPDSGRQQTIARSCFLTNLSEMCQYLLASDFFWLHFFESPSSAWGWNPLEKTWRYFNLVKGWRMVLYCKNRWLLPRSPSKCCTTFVRNIPFSWAQQLLYNWVLMDGLLLH